MRAHADGGALLSIQSPGSVQNPNVGHHQWSPVSRRPISTGHGPFNRTARLMLHEMRWRKPPREYGLHTCAWVVSVSVHVMLFAMLLLARPMPYQPPPAGDEDAIEVRFIESEPPPPPPPPPPKLRHRPVPKAPPRQQVAAAPQPAQAPDLAPVPVPAPAAPEIRIEPVPSELPPLAGAPQPVQRPQVSPPQPEAPAVPAPAPPKLVLERSEMALPPPPHAEVDAPHVTMAPSEQMQPVPVERPTADIGTPKLAITVPDAEPASPAPVARPRAVPPEADLQEVPVPTQAPPQISLDTPARQPVQAEARPPRARALQAPQAEQEALPAAPVQAPVPRIDVASVAEAPAPAPLPAPEPPTPVAVQAPAAEPAEAESEPDETAPATPPQETGAESAAQAESWVKPDDTFRTRAAKTGQGKPNPAGPTGGNGHLQLTPKPGNGSGRGGGRKGEPDYVQLYPHGNSDVMSRSSSQVHYRSTVFDQYWAPANEDALSELLRHFVEKFSVKHTFDLGRGVRVNCVLGPMAIFMGCGGDPPAGPSAKSDDPRLNMAPAALVPGIGTPSAPPPAPPPKSSAESVECATARVAGGPVPPQCGKPQTRPYQSDQW